MQANPKPVRINFKSTPSSTLLPTNPFPLLSQPSMQPNYKLNTIRHTNREAKDEIVQLRARINKLKEENERNRKRSMRSYQEIQKMLETKYNYIEKKRHQSVYQQRTMAERLERIQNTRLARSKEKEALESSKQKSYQQKSTNALIQRQLKTLDSQTRSLEKQKSQQLNAERAKSIKQYEREHKNYMNILNEVSRVKARSNHQQKIRQYVKEKEMLNKTMSMLRKQESSLLTELKKESDELRNIEGEIEAMRVRTGRAESKK